MDQDQNVIPAARKAELVIQEADGETLVYDLKSHKAHCLNRTAALVWKYCDGKHTITQAARKVEAETGMQVSSEVVWLAVAQLEKSRLLEKPLPGGHGSMLISRRELARRLGLATAIALPFIASINAPAAIQAATCGGNGAACGGANPPCCAGFACSPFTNMCQPT
jgi:hypothetical protein